MFCFFIFLFLFSSCALAFDTDLLQSIMNDINCTIPECLQCGMGIVGCDNNENIVNLNFNSINGLNGSLSERLNELTHLTLLVARNFLPDVNLGLLPNLKDLVNLEFLAIENTFLHGTIFSEIGLLTKLISLIIRGDITGLIPTEIDLLSNLRILDIRHSLFATRHNLFGTLPNVHKCQI